MKKLYSLLLAGLLCAGSLRAQTVDSMRYQLDQVFAHVDKSQVPTGLLDAYALPLVPLAPFNGVLQDSVLLNPDLFRGLYATAYTACIYGANPLPTLQTLNANTAAAEVAAGPGVQPVMMQLITYNTIRTDALSQNLMSVQNQQAFDVAGRSQSPYLARTLFAASPAHTNFPSATASFVFPSTLLTTYLPGQPTGFITQTLALDFGDGRGYVPAYFDQVISASYATAGAKKVKVRYTYQIQTITPFKAQLKPGPGPAPGPSPTVYSFETRFGIVVGAPVAGTNPAARTTAGVVSDSVFFAAKSGQASGWAYIHYATGHSQLTKPLIVAKGFDGHFVAPDVFSENYSIRKFLTEIKTQAPFDFRDNLENVGNYDIVFIDYTNGTDDILLNAGLFEAVLTYVNQHKDATAHQQNVVLGLSMGGNIARYKLAEMTKANRPTDVRLLLLNDSPQRGANIPLGLSALIRQLQFNIGPFNVSDMVPALKQANALLDSPAAQQLLLYQTYLKNIVPPGGGYVLGTTVEFRANSFIEGPYRQMISYSAPYKIIAVSEGSQCGKGLFAPYTELIRAGGRLNLYNLPFFLAGSEGINGEIVVNAIPANGQAQRVAGLHVWEETQVFFGLIKKRSDIAPPMNFICPAGLLPLDGAAGGTEGIGSQIGTTGGSRIGYLNIIKNFYKRPYALTFSLVNDFSFIPVPSALDIQDFGLPNLSASYINGIASTSFSRTDGFLAQESFTPVSSASSPFNQAHVFFTPRNTAYMFSQMQNSALPASYCSSECQALTITSSLPPGQRLCAGNSITLSIPGLAPGTAVTWSATPGNFFTVAAGSGPTFTTAATSAASGNGTITATVGSCNNTLSVSVPVGAGEATGRYVVGAFFSGSGTPLRTVNPAGPDKVNIIVDAPYNFTFSADPYVPISIQGGGQASFYMPTNGSSVNITATATNATAGCGVVGHWTFVPSPYRMMITPNPASTELTVARTEADPVGPAATSLAASPQGTTPDASPAFDADLYDYYGRKVRTKRSERGRAVLNVRDLPDGLYVVRVGQGKEAMSQNVQISH